MVLDRGSGREKHLPLKSNSSMAAAHGIATPIYYANMFMFAVTIGFGAAFIVSSVSANFFKWELSNCMTKGEAAGTGRIVMFSIDVEADIGWRDFTVTYLDQGAQDFGCFGTIEQGEKYPIGDYQVRRNIIRLAIGEYWVRDAIDLSW